MESIRKIPLFCMIGHSEHIEDFPIRRKDDKEVERDGMFPSFASTGSRNWKFWPWSLQLPFMISSTQEQQTTSTFRRGKCHEVLTSTSSNLYFSKREGVESGHGPSTYLSL